MKNLDLSHNEAIGYALIELLIAVVIVSKLAAITMSNFLNTYGTIQYIPLLFESHEDLLLSIQLNDIINIFFLQLFNLPCSLSYAMQPSSPPEEHLNIGW